MEEQETKTDPYYQMFCDIQYSFWIENLYEICHYNYGKKYWTKRKDPIVISHYTGLKYDPVDHGHDQEDGRKNADHLLKSYRRKMSFINDQKEGILHIIEYVVEPAIVDSFNPKV